MSNIFNSCYEISLRIVLLIKVINIPINSENIFAYDFIGTYAKEFDLMDISLNGDSEFTLSKISLRRKKIIESINYLVIHKYISPICDIDGIKYILLEKGNSLYNKLKDIAYAQKYVLTIKLAKNLSENNNVLNLILNKIVGAKK